MNKSAFVKIRFAQIQTLLGIITNSKERDFDFVKKNYETRENNFEETFFFLEKLQIIQSYEKRVSINDILVNTDLGLNILKTILEEKGNISDEFREYLKFYRLSDKNLEYEPDSNEENLSKSDVRNFCISMGLIYHEKRRGRDVYILNEKYSTFLSSHLGSHNLMTKKQLMEKLKNQERIGWNAEKRVLEYENERLSGTGLKANIISEENVAAGYDIESWSINPSSKPTRRFIEVKAVSPFTYEFHWTRSEIEESRKLGEQYFLYLLPVSEHEQFDIASMKQIDNPYKQIFESKKDWTIQVDSYTIWKER